MNKRQNKLRFLSLTIFTLGILIGMAIAGGIVWGDLEASLFDSSINANSTLRSLKCPIAITTDEVGIIHATLKNPTDREKSFYVRAHISEGYVSLKREINQQITVAPGEKGKVFWEIYPEDAAYNSVVLFRAYVNASYPVPSQGNFCGVLVLDIPLLSGSQFFLLLLVLSLAGILSGRWLWRIANPKRNENSASMGNAMNALATIVFGSILTGYLGWWILGILLFAVSVLMIGVILGRFVP